MSNAPSDAASDAAINALLLPYRPFGVNLGLARIHRLLAALGNPERQVPTIHVAGTNGKGSVCAYLASVLTAAGYRTGCSTSPHLISWCDRIRLNQQNIAEADFEALLRRVIAAIDPNQPQPTLFEITTAAAWLYFAEQQVDVAVVEVGLGGRLDGTNVKDQVLAAIVTSISKEHWQVLGDTLGKIAGEKAGILKAGCPAIVGPLPEEARAVVAARAAALGCPVTWVEPASRATPQPPLKRGAILSHLGEAPNASLTPDSEPKTPNAPQQSNATIPPLSKGGLGGVALASGITYPLSLMGDIQLTNSAIAIATLQSLRAQGWHISDEAIAQGMAATRWPGRMEWRSWRGHRLLIDGAHNPAAAEVLRDYVDQVWPDLPMTWVMGMLDTKEHDAVLRALLKPGDRLYTVPVPDHSTEPPERLAALGQQLCPGLALAHPCETGWDALALAFAKAGESGDESVSESGGESAEPAVVLCGSLYLLGHSLPQLLRLES